MIREKSEELKKQIYKWQEQRLNRVQKVFDEYNEKGWNTQQTLEAINSSLNSDDEEATAVAQNLQIKPTQFKAYKQAFKNHRVTARDIVLPPFREDYDYAQPTTYRYKTFTSEEDPEEDKKTEDIIEE